MSDTTFLANHTELNASFSDELKNEWRKLHKMELIVEILKQEHAPISAEQRALLSIYKYDGPLPLGLDNIRNVELSYHDRLALNRYVETKILKNTNSVVTESLKLSDNNIDSLDNPALKEYCEVLELDVEKRKLTEHLLVLKNRKLQFMNLCAEMRTGPYQKNKVETKNAECKALQIKSETIQNVMVHEVITSTAHAVKAVKEVEANIDALLDLKQ
ncbi:uncharacterized protein LOC129779824 [Toxorhynchites rutilus septentrionalis]|uniref:uncharacterized protein LOC129779824 n=1 Tax=Toxorhynchites rutilus septentrionalis TaxID=329112 RepID=UPI0024791D99|nr:uncharacterized protein LOC129779824 [Toxorhynchites rutilus septentrionalis]XP_055643517.1 uncharacterized protein LOC129779824 [Toxorhynchites rutilus septentrionalis]XP_055643518.1 uncharacterized protein LOC129779824 [Toxorhynchites rutilus septentrionalis]